MKRWLKPVLTVLILVATLAAFIYYFATHEAVRHQLSQTPLGVIGILLVLYIGTVVALALIFHATLRLCKLSLGTGETALLTAYSSVINFFGPLQSGPAFRAVYLKQKYTLNLKNYATATLVYYFFYGAFSAMLLISGVVHWWLLPLLVLGLLLMFMLHKLPPIAARLKALNIANWYYLAAATALQVCLVVVIYYTELHNLDSSITFSQAIIYTGAANLALFVSLTPGAIGFRESFLLFSQHLHKIDTQTIVAANILDRAMYISLMLLLALFIFGTHANRSLRKTVK